MPHHQARGLFVGLTTLDVIHTVAAPPEQNTKVTALSSDLAAGGPAAVAAITFAALGGRARLVTAIGSGPAASLVHADLASAGVDVIDLAPPGHEIAPSTAIVSRGTGDRLVISGSLHTPQPTEPGSLLDEIDVVLIDGHLPTLALAAVAAAEAAGTPVVVDAGSHKPVFDQVFGRVTDIICSDDYRHPPGQSAECLLQGRVQVVATSHGSRPLTWLMRDEAGQVDVPQVDAVDTLGAGDVLHGGYAWALAAGAERVEALATGVRLASQRVTIAGPREWRTRLRP